MSKTQIHKHQVQRFLDTHFKQPIDKLEVINSGEFSQAYTFENVGKKFVIRFNSFTDEGFKKEAIVHAEYAAVPTPKIIDTGIYDSFHYSITESYNGLQLHKLDGEQIEAVLPNLFATMNTMHTQPVKGKGFGVWGLDQNGAFESFEAQLRRFIHVDKWEKWAAQHPFFDIGFAKTLKVEFDALVQYIPADRYFLHGDFGRTNIFALDNRIEGVIDWSEAMYGDFLLDLAWCAFWESRVDMVAAYYDFNKEHPTLDMTNFEARVRLYLLFSSLNNIVFEVAKGRETSYHDAVLAAKRNLNL